MTNRRQLLGSVLAIALATAPARVVAAAPSGESSGVVRASLSVDTTALGGAAQGVKERIRVRGEALLRAHDVLPGRGAGDPIIAIVVEPLGTEPGYRCAFALRRGDDVLGDTAGTSLCQLCTEDELVDHLEAAIERVVPKVPASTTASRSTSPADPRGPTVPPPLQRAPELRALGKGGLATAIVGAVALGVGVGIAARDAEPRSATRIGGIAVASVSFGLLVAGLAMVIVDVRRHRAWRVSPTAARSGAGVVVGGRF